MVWVLFSFRCPKTCGSSKVWTLIFSQRFVEGEGKCRTGRGRVRFGGLGALGTKFGLLILARLYVGWRPFVVALGGTQFPSQLTACPASCPTRGASQTLHRVGVGPSSFLSRRCPLASLEPTKPKRSREREKEVEKRD